MEEIKIIGYFVDKDGDKSIPSDVFVAIDEVADFKGNLTIYCTIGQHGSASLEYIKECEEITKKEYIEASRGLYTPVEYI